MRTVFVNPSSMMVNPRRKRRKARKAKMANPKRGRRRRTTRVSKGYPITVRANAGIAPFVQNPMIVPNRSRRRARKRNPGLAGLTQPKIVIKKVLTYGGGSAVGAGLNIFALRRVENDYMRNGLRVLAAVLGSAFLPGEFGAAMAGSTLYPFFAELALMSKLISAPATEVDLSEISADLEDLMDDDNEELFVP